jgi:hypothetical protein
VDDVIVLDKKNVISFSGAGAEYLNTPELRERINEVRAAALRSANRFFVLEGIEVRAAQSTRQGADRYMKEGCVLVMCDF